MNSSNNRTTGGPDFDSPERAELLAYARAQEDIIHFYPHGRSAEKLTGSPRQQARAIPNERLVKCFGIDNGFTTSHPGVKAQFLTQSTNKMKAAINSDNGEENWSLLVAAARQDLQEFMESKDKKRVNMAQLVQLITLKLSIRYLFEEDAWKQAFEDSNVDNKLVFIGKRINEIWMESKEINRSERHYQDDNLDAILKSVIQPPSSNDTSKKKNRIDFDKNPMNWLLPAYETMWRVVMRCVIEILYRDAENSPVWNRSLQFHLLRLQFPTVMGQNAFGRRNDDTVSARDIVKEALRLHPPSRRIHRQFSDQPDAEPVKANIEKCHHSKTFGSDPLVFRPERWESIREEYEALKAADDEYGRYKTYLENYQKKKNDIKRYEEYLGFMPFAGICPSDEQQTRGFGMKMIALLAGVLCEGLAHWDLERKEESLPPLPEPLNSDRDAYCQLFLFKAGSAKREPIKTGQSWCVIL